jgi:predicted N-formylglutamate amidohydrolase
MATMKIKLDLDIEFDTTPEQMERIRNLRHKPFCDASEEVIQNALRVMFPGIIVSVHGYRQIG